MLTRTDTLALSPRLYFYLLTRHALKAPGLGFYEKVGSHSFRSAAEHPFSWKTTTEALYQEIADRFPGLRNALNDLSERLITME